MDAGDDILSIRGLTKSFYGALALDNADFTLRRGEIHALVGENGAGKSTFIKILAGVYEKDAGEIRIDGRIVNPRAERLPIAFVHQDHAFAEDLSVGENIAFGAGYPRRAGLIDWKAVRSQALEIYETMDVEPLDPDRMVSTLSAPEKAILAIVRTLARTPKVLVLDEPTAALPEADSMQLFRTMQRLRDKGTSMIYVSHRLNELFGLCDRVTAFRDGRHVATEAIADTSTDRLVEHMLGRPVDVLEAGDESAPSSEKIALRVDSLVVNGRGPVSFDVRQGEILGLVGLRGGGQEAIGRAIFGAVPIDGGAISLFGRLLPKKRTIGGSIEAGLRLLAGNRAAESTFPGMSLTENIFANPRIVGGSLWRWNAPKDERIAARQLLERFDVRPRNEAALIDWLSGGNQQKTCLARWLGDSGRLLILEEPTAGVDIGAKLAIHDILRKAAAAGVSMLVVSTDMEEVAALCRRAIIIDRGRKGAELSGAALTMDNLISRSSQGSLNAA
ncbi:sugar ABC transporter ATP-binding protein [Mesorhizobium sp. CN5-321]|uniref:sugar ABC transporter ATP-binding protein n=1 Tax=Mesorhizobium hunchu TaxID=3157708 RepID=UPI0032B717E5